MFRIECGTRNPDSVTRTMTKYLFTTILFIFSLSSFAVEADPFAALADPWTVMRPMAGRTFQVSSSDPTGGNTDYNHFVRIEPDGTRVLADIEGPGVITRIWITGRDHTLEPGRFRVWIDNGESPLVDTPIRNFFSGGMLPFLQPLVGDAESSSGGYYSYVPIPFEERIVIDLADLGPERLYYNINYKTYPSKPESVQERTPSFSVFESMRLPTRRKATRYLFETLEWWRAPEEGSPWTVQAPKEVTAGTRSVPSRSNTTIISATGEGVLESFRFTLDPQNPALLESLRIRIFWDGEDKAAVDAPLGMFFCTGPHLVDSRGLFLGSVDGTYYSWFPMPFHDGFRMEIVNESGTEVRVRDIRSTVHRVTVEDYPFRFHAQYNRDPFTNTSENYVFLERTARGKFVGVTLRTQGGSGGMAYLEGDEVFYVDGEEIPSIEGTGAEDYFNGGWYFLERAFSQPLHGCPVFIKEPAETVKFRFHLLDSVPFERSIHASIEHGANNTFRGDYESVAYWYEEPGTFRDEPVSIPPLPPEEYDPSHNLLRNPGAERFMEHWITGGEPSSLPAVDPWSHFPDPLNRSGNHRFGISIGWTPADCYQYQIISVTPGQTYGAEFWATHEEGTGEYARMKWIDGPWPGEEHTLLQTATERQPNWTLYSGATFTPTSPEITILMRYRYTVPTSMAAIHVDDIRVFPIDSKE